MDWQKTLNPLAEVPDLLRAYNNSELHPNMSCQYQTSKLSDETLTQDPGFNVASALSYQPQGNTVCQSFQQYFEGRDSALKTWMKERMQEQFEGQQQTTTYLAQSHLLRLAADTINFALKSVQPSEEPPPPSNPRASTLSFSSNKKFASDVVKLCSTAPRGSMSMPDALNAVRSCGTRASCSTEQGLCLCTKAVHAASWDTLEQDIKDFYDAKCLTKALRLKHPMPVWVLDNWKNWKNLAS